jgi:hypothetical protein
MFKLDNDFLVSLGLGGLPVDEKNKLLQAIYERLEMNVGMRLAEKMTDAQLDEFEGFIDRNDEAGALRWLETNFPNYKDVVAEELEKLKTEVSAAAPQILSTAQTANGQSGTPPQFQSSPQPMPSQQPEPQYQPPQPQIYPEPTVSPSSVPQYQPPSHGQPGQPPMPSPSIPMEQPMPPSAPPYQPQPGFPPAGQPVPPQQQQFSPPPPEFNPEDYPVKPEQ